MREPIELTAGLWWRFDRYDIRDGYIRPEPGAKLERYDPWANYRAARGRGRDTDPPFQSLLRLLKRVVIRPTGREHLYALTPDSKTMVISWCEKYGLLGVLIQRAQAVALAPRWEQPMQSASDAVQNHRSDDLLMPILRQYFRTSLGWADRQQVVMGRGTHGMADAPKQQGQLVPSDTVPREWPRPHVLLHDLDKAECKEEPLGKTWAQFFPDVPQEQRETRLYPVPLSEQFWTLYAEPVDAFFEAANVLQQAVEGLSHAKPVATASEDDDRRLLLGMKRLHVLAAPASPVIIPQDDGSFEQRWIAPSLLASLAMMVLQDLTGNRALTCEVCGAPFLSSAYQGRYCSKTCGYTARKRRQRAKKKEKSHGETRPE